MRNCMSLQLRDEGADGADVPRLFAILSFRSNLGSNSLLKQGTGRKEYVPAWPVEVNSSEVNPVQYLSRNLTASLAVLLLNSPTGGMAANKSRTTAATETTARGPLYCGAIPGISPPETFITARAGRHTNRHGTFTFEKEDMAGSNPKFDVVDQDGIKWRVKMGDEARPETVASRLVWAVGYFANEDYFMPILHVQNMPHLHRGANLVSAGRNRTQRPLEETSEGREEDWHLVMEQEPLYRHQGVVWPPGADGGHQQLGSEGLKYIYLSGPRRSAGAAIRCDGPGIEFRFGRFELVLKRKFIRVQPFETDRQIYGQSLPTSMCPVHRS